MANNVSELGDFMIYRSISFIDKDNYVKCLSSIVAILVVAVLCFSIFFNVSYVHAASNNAPVNITLSNNQVFSGAGSGTIIGSLTARDADAGDSHNYVLYSGENSENNNDFQIVNNNLVSTTNLSYSTSSKADVAVVGSESRNYNFDIPGFVGTPDGPVTFVKEGGQYIVFTSNGEDQAMYRYTTTDFMTFSTPQKVFEGSGVATNFDGEYAGPGTVIKLNNGTYVMYYHAEKHVCGLKKPITFSIGKATSTNQGLSWTRQSTPVLTGRDTNGTCSSMESSNRAGQGAGYPSVVKQGGYFYMFYTDWKGSGTFEWAQTHVARASVNSNGAPGTFKKYNLSSYNSAAIGGQSTAVLKEEANEPHYYAQAASVSYNVSLNKFIAVYQTNMGFYTRTSTVSGSGNKGVNWEKHEPILEFQDPYTTTTTHSSWYSYPTLLSTDRTTSMETSETGKLIYAATHDYPDLTVTGIGEYHEAHERPFALTKKGRKNVRLYSTDNQGGYFQEDFSIYIMQPNNAPTLTQITPNSPWYPNPQHWSLVEENQPALTNVGTFTSTDPEGDIVFYSECSETQDNPFFEISGNNLLTSTVFDFENPQNVNQNYPNNYTLCIRTTDTSGNVLDSWINVIVTDGPA